MRGEEVAGPTDCCTLIRHRLSFCDQKQYAKRILETDPLTLERGQAN